MLEKKIEKLRKESLRNANRQFNIGMHLRRRWRQYFHVHDYPFMTFITGQKMIQMTLSAVSASTTICFARYFICFPLYSRIMMISFH